MPTATEKKFTPLAAHIVYRSPHSDPDFWAQLGRRPYSGNSVPLTASRQNGENGQNGSPPAKIPRLELP